MNCSKCSREADTLYLPSGEYTIESAWEAVIPYCRDCIQLLRCETKHGS